MKYIFILVFAFSVIFLNVDNKPRSLQFPPHFFDVPLEELRDRVLKWYPPDTVIVIDFENDTSYVEIIPGHYYFKNY
jgi:hypothetical protein